MLRALVCSVLIGAGLFAFMIWGGISEGPRRTAVVSKLESLDLQEADASETQGSPRARFDQRGVRVEFPYDPDAALRKRMTPGATITPRPGAPAKAAPAS